jgi:hypothetical protein
MNFWRATGQRWERLRKGSYKPELILIVVLGLGVTGAGTFAVAADVPDETPPTPTQIPTVIPPSPTPTEIPLPTAVPSPTPTPSPTAIPEYTLPIQNWNKDSDPLNGYFQPDRGWIPGMVSHESWNIPHPTYSYGGAVWYASGVMHATAYARGYSLEGYLDGVSLMSPADVGETVWMRLKGGEWEGPYLVVDCAQINHHFAAAYYNKETVEVGWNTAVRWGMVGYGVERQWVRHDVEVYKSIEAPTGDIGYPVFYPDWWLNQVTFQ